MLNIHNSVYVQSPILRYGDFFSFSFISTEYFLRYILSWEKEKKKRKKKKGFYKEEKRKKSTVRIHIFSLK